MPLPDAFSSLPVQTNVPLATLTTYKIGGPADYFIEADSSDQLAKAVVAARTSKIPYFILGTGANILIADAGFRGLVIHNHAGHISIDGNRLTAESGATMAQAIEVSANAGLSGLEHFTGIPSSIGGAIWQNLHFLSPDRDRTVFIAEVLESAHILDQHNQQHEVDVNFFQFGYDDSLLHHQEIVVLDATFNLTALYQATIRQRMAANLEWRGQRHPDWQTLPSCGSVFQKIEGVGAGRLIEQVGLKGHRLGNAQISEKHANFIINLGGATAHDVLSLARLAQQTVEQKTGYHLKMEIGLIGEFTPEELAVRN